jgi:hypothetical protein
MVDMLLRPVPRLRNFGSIARLALLLTTVAFAAPLSGCGGELEDTGESEDDLKLQPTVKGSVGDQVRLLTIPELRSMRYTNDDGLRGWEGLVDNFGKADPTVHIVDNDRFDGHFGYVQNALKRPTTHDEFFALVRFPESRKYMPFQVYDFRKHPITRNGKTFQWVMNIRRYDYGDTEKQLAEVLVTLRALLSERLWKGFGEPLLFVYESNIGGTSIHRRPHVSELGEIHKRGFTTITESDILKLPQ